MPEPSAPLGGRGAKGRGGKAERLQNCRTLLGRRELSCSVSPCSPEGPPLFCDASGGGLCLLWLQGDCEGSSCAWEKKQAAGSPHSCFGSTQEHRAALSNLWHASAQVTGLSGVLIHCFSLGWEEAMLEELYLSSFCPSEPANLAALQLRGGLHALSPYQLRLCLVAAGRLERLTNSLGLGEGGMGKLGKGIGTRPQGRK